MEHKRKTEDQITANAAQATVINYYIKMTLKKEIINVGYMNDMMKVKTFYVTCSPH
jgi:hypothetical protein